MTAEPPPGHNPYGSAPPPHSGGYPSSGGYPPQGAYGAPQGAYPPAGASAPLAEWWERWVARFIDSLIFTVVSWILGFILAAVFGVGILSVLLAAVISYAAYTAYDYVLHSKDGQTIGKKIMKIQLVGAGGAPLDSSALQKRAAVYPGVFILSGIPFVNYLVYVFGLVLGILLLVDKGRQGLHDKIAGTVVVKVAR
jgi:uncharacterized RDD family membrane protein YckC